jgi:hypothetical protein
MESRKGLSTIVATLIIVLLVLVAVGIIWVVIRNVVESGAEQIDITNKCLAIDLQAVSVNETSAGVYDVTIERSDGSAEVLGGIKVNILNGTDSSGVMDFPALTAAERDTLSLDTSTEGDQVDNGDEMQYTAFFIDASGNEQLCSQPNTFTF